MMNQKMNPLFDQTLNMKTKAIRFPSVEIEQRQTPVGISFQNLEKPSDLKFLIHCLKVHYNFGTGLASSPFID